MRMAAHEGKHVVRKPYQVQDLVGWEEVLGHMGNQAGVKLLVLEVYEHAASLMKSTHFLHLLKK